MCEEGGHNSEEEIFSDGFVGAIQSLICSFCTFWSSTPLTLKLIEEHSLALGFPWIVSFCLGGSGGGRSSVRSALLEEVVSEEAWLAELAVVVVDSPSL